MQEILSSIGCFLCAWKETIRLPVTRRIGSRDDLLREAAALLDIAQTALNQHYLEAHPGIDPVQLTGDNFSPLFPGGNGQ